VRLCGLCDPCAGDGEDLARGVPRFADWGALLAAAAPDLAIIASPTRTHFALARQALEAGVHTFVEKPIVTRRREFDCLCRIAAARGCRLMAGHVERYNPVAIKLRDLLAAGGVAAAGYRFHRSQPHDARIPDDIVVDKAVHDADLAQFLFLFGKFWENFGVCPLNFCPLNFVLATSTLTLLPFPP